MPPPRTPLDIAALCASVSHCFYYTAPDWVTALCMRELPDTRLQVCTDRDQHVIPRPTTLEQLALELNALPGVAAAVQRGGWLLINVGVRTRLFNAAGRWRHDV